MINFLITDFYGSRDNVKSRSNGESCDGLKRKSQFTCYNSNIVSDGACMMIVFTSSDWIYTFDVNIYSLQWSKFGCKSMWLKSANIIIKGL